MNLLLWAVYALLNGVMAGLYWSINALTLALCIGLLLVLYGISTAIRQRALRRQWLSLPGGQLLARVLLVVLCGAALAQVVMHGVLRVAACWLAMPLGGTARAALLGYWINTAIVLGLWCAGWFGWQSITQARKSRMAQLQAEARAARLQHDALRARLNPHFLFNALNNLRALIHLNPARARQQVDDLSLLLRHALGHGDRDSVSLEEELTVVEAYLAMEGIHHEERLQVVRIIDPAVLAARVPPMAVQLLVENAVKLGIAVTPGGGTLSLQVGPATQGRVRVEVRSPGKIGQGAAGHGVGMACLQHTLAPLQAFHGLEQDSDAVLAWIEVPA